MTSEPITQQKKVLGNNILEVLMVLRTHFGLTSREIAQKLGINENYLSKVLTGKKVGSPQLLAGLELLKELTILKRSGVNQELARELETMKTRIEELQRATSSRYPEHVPQSMALNQETAPFSSSPAGGGAVAAAKAAVPLEKKKKSVPPSK